ncbi:zinc carboxypeptidase [Belliella sp. R4-6]|uniref:Zinc carboxypeptidase n=1 Tax=Belliella alkalica TaxID=1730871 RepID=A0ABS9VBN6_9BACT|nr:M14 family zinc carboxypeptidase [Belliella alkalica]MCH7413475.1 zinc carboxypeptidase [Belliella alkalica]
MKKIKKTIQKAGIAIILFFISIIGYSQIDLSYYMPDNHLYDPDIPTPKDVLGFEVGEWHASYDQVVMYMNALAAASDRVTIEVIGRTYEMRPQLTLTITSPSNHSKIEEIKSERKKLRLPNANLETKDMPVVVYAGYSVHGNEASAVNASLLAAYHFAASNEVAPDLENMIILIDPSLNPDGVNRFASWVNSNKSYTPNGDPANRELNEPWPRSRTNHYWFDLNRDWLPVQHPESRNRVAVIQEWLPNIQLDFHEMGTNSTYFFQPGVPSRSHPLTPKRNFELTEKISRYHAHSLDSIGSLYYSKEDFDDFNYGKGSTYPDVQGSIGILFEQASSRGHLQESIYGPLKFEFTIKNQFNTTLSSIKAAKELREELNAYLRDFYKEAKTESDLDTDKAFIFGTQEDAGRGYHLADLVLQHDIDLYSLMEDITVNGVEFKKEKAYIVPLNQPQYRLIKGIFEERTVFQDSLFYDVSAWTMPMAFNMKYMALSSRILNLASVEQVTKSHKLREGNVNGEAGAKTYAFEWGEYYAPKAAYQLLKKGYLVRVSHAELETNDGIKFKRGSIFVDKGQSKANDKKFYEDLLSAAKSTGVEIYSINSSNTKGINLGSPSIDVLDTPNVALLVDGGVSSSEAGEIWHLLDQRFEIPVTLLPLQRFNTTDINRYNTILAPNGSYNDLGKEGTEKLKSWVNAGGTLIAQGTSLAWLDQNGIGSFKFKTETIQESENQKPYADFNNATGARVTGGAIFNVRLDNTHPIGYGYETPDLYSFRSGNQFLIPSENPYANPMIYTSEPLASGYVHPFNLDQIRESATISISTVGRGKVIGFVDNPNFRAFWFGTNKLYLNAIFFGKTIKAGTGR